MLSCQVSSYFFSILPRCPAAPGIMLRNSSTRAQMSSSNKIFIPSMQSSTESVVAAETIQSVLIPRVKIHNNLHVSIMESSVKIEPGLMERKKRWHGRYKRNKGDQSTERIGWKAAGEMFSSCFHKGPIRPPW